jgi:heptaprenyl diphosphate synthase
MGSAFVLGAHTNAVVTREIAAVLANVCEARVRELRGAGRTDISETEYLEVVTQRSAALFELPCRLGAYLAGASTGVAEAVTKYGRDIGIAFQLGEDIRAFRRQPAEAAKASLNDLREGVCSLPVLVALRSGGTRAGHLHELLTRGRMSSDQVAECLEIVRESGSLSAVLNVARRHADSAQRALALLPDSPARRMLARLATHTVVRAEDTVNAI